VKPSIAASIAAGLVCAGALAHAQRFTSQADAVRVDVLVMDGRKAVRGLTAADFEIRDNNVVQTVRQVEVERLPLNVICVFDTSGSVAGPRLDNLLLAGHALLDGLQPRDRVALLTFANRVSLQSTLTGDHERIWGAMALLQANGTTSLRDAAFAGLALRESDPGRTLLLLFSDGADTSSWLPAARVIEAAKRTDVVVYPVALPDRIVTTMTMTGRGRITGSDLSGPANSRPIPSNVTVRFDNSSRFLDDLADETGGRVVRVESDRDLRATFVSTLTEFRDRYVLMYAPTGVAQKGWHQLTVRLKGKKGTVTARRGYFAQ
jgi:Ca-activated chloride channel family protein